MYSVQVNGQAVELSTVNMGNPHAVLLVDNVETADVATLGPALESHARFPERVNVGFLQVVDRHHARLRVFERGTGETLACGTGACAAVVAGIRRGLLDSPVKVALSGGELNIHWAGVGEPVIMIGPTARVYDGVIRLPDVAMPEPQDCGQDRPRGPRPGGSRNKKKEQIGRAHV